MIAVANYRSQYVGLSPFTEKTSSVNRVLLTQRGGGGGGGGGWGGRPSFLYAVPKVKWLVQRFPAKYDICGFH